MRRLTRLEFDNTVFQLLGENLHLAEKFVPEEEALGFTNQAAALTVSPLLAEQYMEAAETLAAKHAPRLIGQLPNCTSDAAKQSACTSDFRSFFRDFAGRAFRRPLTDAELADWSSFFEGSLNVPEQGYDPTLALDIVLEATLQSPDFLYRVEFGNLDAAQGDVVPLTDYEMASRLSYMFWNTMPDDALFAAAAKGELKSKAQIEQQARRLLKAPRAREAVKNFHREWLKLREIDAIAASGKSTAIYPDYDQTVFPLLREETERFFDYAIFEERASVDALFSAPYTMMNERLAEFYGVPGVTGSAWRKVELDPRKYSGFLSHAGLLALHAKPDRSSPIHRGLYVRKSLLCQEPPPPPDVVPEAPNVDPTKTTREQFAMHESEAVCAGCHKLIDKIGLGFEHFDGLGRYRDKENGLAIDATGEVLGTLDADGPFDGVVELGEQLGQSQQVRDCVAKQWFRFSYGRGESDADLCSMNQLEEVFEKSGYDIQELLVALTQIDAFRYRHVNAGEP